MIVSQCCSSDVSGQTFLQQQTKQAFLIGQFRIVSPSFFCFVSNEHGPEKGVCVRGCAGDVFHLTSGLSLLPGRCV